MAHDHVDIAVDGWRSVITRIKRAVSWRRTLVTQVIDLQGQVLELHRAVSEPKMRALMENIVTMRSKEIGTLTDHAVKALRLLIDAGVITQEQANEVIQ
jgi:hypothetical protein